MSLVKRLFVFALAVTTVLWSFGASLAPVQAEGNYGAGSLLALEGQAGQEPDRGQELQGRAQ